MITHHITRILSAALVVAALAMGAVLDWPIWVWFLLATLCAGSLLIDMRIPRQKGGNHVQDPAPDEAAPEPAERTYQETRVVAVPVESSVAGCPFLISATVWWRLADEGTSWSHGNPAALASTSVLRRVQQMTSTEHPNRYTFLEHSMESVLGLPVSDDEGLVVAFATDIRLVLRQKDREHLDELDGLRKAVDTWESRREHERNVREYLGDDVLQSPGSAVVWWMARHDDQIERAVEMIAPLTVLSATANDKEIPEAYRDLFREQRGSTEGDLTGAFEYSKLIGEDPPQVGETNWSTAEQQPSMSSQLSSLMESMGIAEGSVEGAAFLHRLAQMSDAVGRPEAAEAIRMNLREQRREGGPTATDSVDGFPPDPPSAASGTYTSPPQEDESGGQQRDRAPHFRAGSWQVTSEGLVSEADDVRWSSLDKSGLDDPDPHREGDER